MDASRLITELGLERHPEGGWYKETWRAAPVNGTRAGATAIYFLLDAGERSHWHRVDAAEIWLWHAGAPLTLLVAELETGSVVRTRLGPDVPAGELPQWIVEPGAWQAADADTGWTLVSCVVSPGFEFSGFELAPADWEPGARPDHRSRDVSPPDPS